MLFEQSKAGITRGNHCVYSTAYHLVLVTYRRRRLLSEEVRSVVTGQVKGILENWGGCLLEAKGEEDHLHLLISIPPKYSISKCIGTIKQATAKKVHREFQYLRVLPQNGRLWSASFYLATVGETDIDTVTQYIRSQGEERRPGHPKKGEGVMF